MTVDVGLLLEIIQQYSFIYDKQQKGFKDPGKKNNAWKEIAETLGCSVDEVKTRWRTLRERFTKELKNHEENTRSGQSQEDTSQVWEWFDSLLFLANHIRPRKTCSSKLKHDFNSSSLEETDIEPQNEEMPEALNDNIPQLVLKSPPPSTPSSSRTSSSTGKKRPFDNTVSHKVDEELLKTLEQIKSTPVEDEDELFCKAIACELRKIKDMEEKQRIKA